VSERLNDLMKQGLAHFKAPRPRKRKPTVSCEACLNWHEEGRHTASPEARRANLKEARDKRRARKANREEKEGPGMRVKITDIKATERTVELPEACPHCGADFTKPGNLRQDGWAPTAWGAYIAGSGRKKEIENTGDSEDLTGALHTITTGYSCGACRGIIVTTEA